MSNQPTNVQKYNFTPFPTENLRNMGVMIAALNNIPFTILIALLKGIPSHAKPAHTL